MAIKILYVERQASDFVSLEKVFRGIAANLSTDFEYEFQQLPFGPRVWHTVGNLLFFRKKKADIYHITGGIHYIALRLSPRNTVLTIHDVRLMYNKSGLRRWLLKKLYLDWPLGRLRYVTAISEHAKMETVQYSGCPAELIRVLENPLLIEEDLAGTPEFDQQLPTLLQVGTMPNKNIPNVARALRGINAKLRMIGPVDPHLRSVLEENEINYENVSNITDEELRDEYRKADIVIFCSKFEGFGLPIIEAQAMKKPVITSDLSPMMEVAGGGAHLSDPNDPTSIREGIEKIINDRQYREILVAAGLKNIRRFDPKAIAGQYENLYRTILLDGANEKAH